MQNANAQVNTCSTSAKSLYCEKLTVAVRIGGWQTLNLTNSTFSVAQISIPVVGVTCTIDPILIIDRSRISQAMTPTRGVPTFYLAKFSLQCLKMTEIELRWAFMVPPFSNSNNNNSNNNKRFILSCHLPTLMSNCLSLTSLALEIQY